MAKAELVFIPTPGMGHLLSAVEFAKLIVKNNQLISILVIIFHMPIYNLTAIEAYIDSQSRELDPNRFTFLTLPPLPDLPDTSSTTFFHTIVELQKPLIERALKARSMKPVAFVLDLLCVSMIDIANELRVPWYIYFTAGASFLNVMLHFQALADDKGVDFVIELCNSNAELELPGYQNRVPVKVLPSVFVDKEAGWSSLIHDITRRFRGAKGILVNSFLELETYAIETLQDKDEVPNVYPVGPIVALDNVHGPHDEDRDSIMQWLDKQPPSSVVFLCFGSMGSFNVDQVKEIAKGLDRIEHRFLWSLRRQSLQGRIVCPTDETFEDALPEGFLGRTAHRGKIIGWAPQIQILGHRAVGGFVSHCGWNSILESLWFGVPIATWPIYSEQQMNAFELVKELEFGVEIRMDYRSDLRKNHGNFTVMAEEVESGIDKLMSMDECMRNRIREISNKSRKVLETGGSSHDSLTRFVTEVLDNVSIH